MKICSKCHVLCENICPICDSPKKLRDPEINEPVLLCTVSAVQAMLIEPILADSGIPYSRPGTLSSALSLGNGMMLDSNRFYVPFAAFTKAREIVEETFGEDEAIMRALHEFDAKEEV